MFISHDLSTVASFANRIVVLYAGRVAEQGPTQRILSPPHHPYTRLLLNSVPEMRTGWLEAHRSTRVPRFVTPAASVVSLDSSGRCLGPPVLPVSAWEVLRRGVPPNT